MRKIKLNLQIKCHKENHIPKKKKIKTWIKSIIKKKCEITIRIVNISKIKKLNFLYRNKNQSTNILSFPFDSPKHIKSKILGDLVICASIIKKEAILQNKTIDVHWAHIIIHGTLHLLGYNHNNLNTSSIMEKIEIKAMINLGYNDPYLI
ncbi:rRNA maturation RNase YbeY [Buchnera aphidicola]|uniref:rRNA maturation RNase YbeY n=1 Tax=Buchnera aphidicola TaxID=9 RepID=UPI003464237D